MASIKALCLAGVASLAVTAAANAADLLPPPPPVEVPAVYAAPAFGGNWYLRGDAGVSITNFSQKSSTFNPKFPAIPDLRYEESSLDDTGFIDAGVGYRFNQYFRADITGEYRGAAHYSSLESYKCQGSPNCRFTPRGYDAYSGSISSAVGLANGYVDLGTWYAITPFIGAGVGAAYVNVGSILDQGAEAGAGALGFSGGHSQTNFAFAFMAGLDLSVTQNLKLEVGYRYLDEGNIQTGTINCQGQPGVCPKEVQHFRLASNDIRLGFRYTFADFVPAPEPFQGPLVRKY